MGEVTCSLRYGGCWGLGCSLWHGVEGLRGQRGKVGGKMGRLLLGRFGGLSGAGGGIPGLRYRIIDASLW